MSVAFSKALVPSRINRQPSRQIERTAGKSRNIYADVTLELYGELQQLSLQLPERTLKAALLHVIEHWRSHRDQQSRPRKRPKCILTPPLPFPD